jgi:2',3'-cyclic-nucleotide 2'-phosphodiesterase (5'-nucleotidase family)
MTISRRWRRAYGRVGGLDRVATVINAIRADRPDALLLDGGDTWHGSYTCYHTEGQDMVNVMNALKPDAMTFHWEFTLGIDRVHELVESCPSPRSARTSSTPNGTNRPRCSSPTPCSSAAAPRSP